VAASTFVRARWVVLGIVAGAVLGAAAASAQSTTFVVGPTVLVDTDFTPSAKASLGLFADGWFGADRAVSWGGLAGYARADFPVGQDELHRHHGWAALSVRARTSAGSAVGVSLGLGALAWDDVNETDSAFRSSADLEMILLPGIEVRLGGSDSVEFVAHVRDQVSGWVDAILDPEEGAFQHRMLIGVGIVFR